MIEWVHAFLLTQAVEMPIYGAVLAGRTAIKRLVLAFVPSLLTHPLVWIFVTEAGVQKYWLAVFESEMSAVLVEGLILQAFRLRFAFLWSFLANASSLSVGLLIQRL